MKEFKYFTSHPTPICCFSEADIREREGRQFLSSPPRALVMAFLFSLQPGNVASMLCFSCKMRVSGVAVKLPKTLPWFFYLKDNISILHIRQMSRNSIL